MPQGLPVLTISGLSIALPAGADRDLALSGVDVELRAGEIHCVVGESGSGKSMTASAVLGLLPDRVRVTAGHIGFEGRDLLALDEAQLRHLRGARIGMIFQEPMTALNPLKTIGWQIGEMYRTHTRLSSSEIKSRVLALLEDVHIPAPAEAAKAYPHQLSGGQRQRAMIAMALALEPAVLIADEPTTALDVTTQAQILKLIRELQARKNTAVLFITHDFGVVAEIADRITVMQHGKVVEHGVPGEVLTRPRHPYTRGLIAAIPSLVPPRHAAPTSEPILVVENISKEFSRSSLFRRGRRAVRAVEDVSLSLPRGSTLGIVGESGSGKSTLARCLARLIEPDTGSIRIDDLDVTKVSRRQWRNHARKIQMVFQDPYASLNPRRRAGYLVAQGLMAHGLSRAKALARAAELFDLVGLDPAAIERYPHEFSGGQRQRIGIARALALEPEVLLADEPVSALDVSVQAQVLELLAELRKTLGLSMIFITHDLRVASQICDSVVVMKDGRVVETGLTSDVFANPRDPYTRRLLDAVPGRSWDTSISSNTDIRMAG